MLVTLRGQRVQELLQLVIISFILMTLMFDSGWYCKEKLDASHSKGSKGSSVGDHFLYSHDHKVWLRVILWGEKGSDLLLRCLNHHDTSKHETLSGPLQRLCTLQLVAYCLFCRNLMDDNPVCYKIPNVFGCMWSTPSLCCHFFYSVLSTLVSSLLLLLDFWLDETCGNWLETTLYQQ